MLFFSYSLFFFPKENSFFLRLLPKTILFGFFIIVWFGGWNQQKKKKISSTHTQIVIDVFFSLSFSVYSTRTYVIELFLPFGRWIIIIIQKPEDVGFHFIHNLFIDWKRNNNCYNMRKKKYNIHYCHPIHRIDQN